MNLTAIIFKLPTLPQQAQKLTPVTPDQDLEI
jgi:hypothetical protein